MKTIATLLFGFALMLSSFASQPFDGYMDFYKQQRHVKNTVCFKIPASFASIFIDKNEEPEVKEFLQNLDDLSFLIIDKVSRQTLLDLNESMPEQLYKQLMVVRDGSAEVNFLIRENAEYVKELVMTIIDSDELVVLCFTGEITHEAAKKIAKSINVQSAAGFRQ
jgi:hypothetical protein